MIFSDKPPSFALPAWLTGKRGAWFAGCGLFLLVCVVIPLALTYGFTKQHEAQVIAVVLGLIAGGLALRYPFCGLIVFAGLLYTRPEEVIPPLNGMHFSLIAAIVTLIGLLIQKLQDREPGVKTPLNTMIIGFGMVVIISAMQTSDDPMTAIQEVGKLVLLVLLVVNLVRSPERYRIYVGSLLLFTVYLAFYSIYRFFHGDALLQGTAQGLIMRSQLTGIFGDPNDLAATIDAGLALALANLARTRGWARAGYLALSLLLIWSILLTNSRGGVIAMMLTLGAFLMIFTRVKVLALLLAVVFAVGVLKLGPSRMSELDTREESANSRFWFWSTGVDVVLHQPLTGVGYDKFYTVNGGATAHNSFVLCFGELGLPGYFCWIGCIYYCYRRRSAPKVGAETFRGMEAQSDPLRPTRHSTALAPLLPAETSSPPQKGRFLPPDPEFYDRSGARLALMGFLAAAFWISRTYIPVLYLLISLPVAQQMAFAPPKSDWHITPSERFRDYLQIAAICLISIAFIGIISHKLK